MQWRHLLYCSIILSKRKHLYIYLSGHEYTRSVEYLMHENIGHFTFRHKLCSKCFESILKPLAASTREKAWVYQSTRPCLPRVTQLMTVFCVHLVKYQPQTGASGAVCPSGQAAWTVHHVQNHTLLCHFSSQPVGPPCLASPLAFGLIGLNKPDTSKYWLTGGAFLREALKTES